MSYFRTNNQVAVNIRMITSAGVPVTGLTQPQILLTLIRSGVTQAITGLYTISEQQQGIYRVVFDASLMTVSDTDYILIAQDSTLQAINDVREFTLYVETIDTVKAEVDTDMATIIAELNVIETDIAGVQNSVYVVDSSVASIPVLTAQQVWSYANRFLTGASGLNQIDVYGIDMQFAVGKDVIINVAMIDALGYAVTGRIWAGPTDSSSTLSIGLWKGGIATDNSGLALITSTETAPGVYRTTIPGSLLNVAGTDYLLVIDDLILAALTQRTEFSVFNVTGVTEPKVVTINVQDSFTLLPIPDTQVYIKDPANTMIINKGVTNVSGSYNTGLTDGTYNVFLRKTFVEFPTPIQLVVNADTTAVYLGTSFSPSNPSSPDTCIVYGWISGMDGLPVRNAKVTASDTFSARYSGSYKIGKVSKVTSTDINGYWELELIKNSQLTPSRVPYQITQTYTGFSYEKDIIVPDTSSVNFSTLPIGFD